MDSDSDDQLLEDDEFPDLGIELSFNNRLPKKPGNKLLIEFHIWAIFDAKGGNWQFLGKNEF